MAAACPQCRRLNPPQAQYCYHDGIFLGRGAGVAEPPRPAASSFPRPFVFPSGAVCVNVDQLALTCQHSWPDGVAALQSGALRQFFQEIGRLDLARAAEDAAHFPEPDRGLDQFLGALGSGVLLPPRVFVHPARLDRGTMKLGQQEVLTFDLANQGHRLVFGMVASSVPWLEIQGAGADHARVVQFAQHQRLTVTLRGDKMVATQQPITGRLEIETNAGVQTVEVTGHIPIVPFPEGVLVGSRTPREVATKARDLPREACELFSNGAVAHWYRANGWTYPVEGPIPRGMAAVQQFFEALGLTKPPKIVLSTPARIIQGPPGASFQTTLKLKTDERKALYAFGTCYDDWVRVMPPQLRGNRVTIPVLVTVPEGRPGPLKSVVEIQANGRQTFLARIIVEPEGS